MWSTRPAPADEQKLQPSPQAAIAHQAWFEYLRTVRSVSLEEYDDVEQRAWKRLQSQLGTA